MRTARAELLVETDNQYTVLVWTRASRQESEIFQGATLNLSLQTAMNAIRDALIAMPTGTERHTVITLSTSIE